MLIGFLSLCLLLIFSELAAANFKRLAPVLEAWDQSKARENQAGLEPFPWKGGWEKLAALIWALGASIPLISFALACRLFLEDRSDAANLVFGATVGTNILALTVAFGLLLITGPLTFFRVRSITSPVFLLLATVAFTATCLNLKLLPSEGLLLLAFLGSYGLYFRKFSSEWKHYERTFSHQSLVDSTEGLLPVLALLCMGLGFFLLSVLAAYPLIQAISESAWKIHAESGLFRLGAHGIALALSFPWLLRCLSASRAGSTDKAVALSSIGHACLLNVLLVPALVSFLGARDLEQVLVSVHLPILFILTGIFVGALLVEKEKGGRLSWVLFALYLAYTIVGWKN